MARALSAHSGVTIGASRRGFGSDALQVNGRIFAMVSRGRLVLKLPHQRIAALIASRDGTPFDAGRGTALREWVVLTERCRARWLDLASEAETFVRHDG